MALAASAPFASFDVNANTNVQDYSPFLSEAIYLDLNWLSQGINVGMDSPVYDTTHIWNQESLNARTGTVGTASVTSFGTAIAYVSATPFHIGDEIFDTSIGSTEIMQITDIASGSLTVTRAYGGSAALSIAASATLAIVGAFQEGSDIATDGSVAPTAFLNYTQTIFGKDLLLTRQQRLRRMMTGAMEVTRQLANRATEIRFDLTRATIYGEKNATTAVGSDTQYRTMAGVRAFIRDNSGVTNATAAALSYANLNTYNKSVVDKGKYPNRLACGTDLVGSISGYDASNRVLAESDSMAGYQVTKVRLNQGNVVEVVVDGRFKTGDAFLYANDQITALPFVGSAMFVIAATDFVDGVKRRIGGDWTVEVRHPEATAWLSAKL